MRPISGTGCWVLALPTEAFFDHRSFSEGGSESVLLVKNF